MRRPVSADRPKSTQVKSLRFLLRYLKPYKGQVAAALLAWLILSEPVGASQIAGGLVVLIGIFLARRGSR